MSNLYQYAKTFSITEVGALPPALRRPAAILPTIGCNRPILRISMSTQPDLNPGDDAAPGTPGAGEDICDACAGRGTLADGKPCPQCGGTGRVMEGIGGG
jgi:hypothetical protein